MVYGVVRAEFPPDLSGEACAEGEESSRESKDQQGCEEGFLDFVPQDAEDGGVPYHVV